MDKINSFLNAPSFNKIGAGFPPNANQPLAETQPSGKRLEFFIEKIGLKNITVFCLLSAVCALFCGCEPSFGELALQYDRTCERQERRLTQNPHDLASRLKLANFYYKFNDYEKINDLLVNIESKDAKILLAKTLVRQKNYSGALEIFEKLEEQNDQEYLYLYAQALEEKNLFPKALSVYEKICSPFILQAKERIKRIGIKIEDEIPQDIKNLLKEEERFISSIDKEEAVILLADEEIEINEDNSSLASVRVVQKVLKEKGKDLAEVELGYDSTHERVELEFARTITTDGKVVYAGKENIRDVSKYLNFPLYSNAKALIISMPSVGVGSIIEYKAKLYSSKLIDKDNFSFVYHLRERLPIAKANFTLKVPKNKNVKFNFLNEQYAKSINLSPVAKDIDGKKSYLWQFKEIAPIIPEGGMPPISEVNPAIAISSFDSWEEIYSWWHELYKDKIILEGEVKKFLQTLIKDCKDDLEKIKRIYEFCAKDIRYVAVEYGDSGYEPHRAQDIFWNRYGDCKDKAILLVALLREAGFKAYPVLIPTRGAFSLAEDFPSVNFNHAIAALLYKEQLVFMDATSTSTSFFDLPLDDQQRYVLVFLEGTYKILETPLFSKNETKYQTNIRIDTNEDAFVERIVTTEGYFAAYQRYYLKNTHPQAIKDSLEERVIRISPYAKLLKYSVENVDTLDVLPVLKYSFTASKFLNPANNLRIMPSLGDIALDVAVVGKDQRLFPVDFEGIFKNISSTKITLPPNLRIKFLPKNYTILTEWFDFRQVGTFEGNSLDFYQEFAIKKRILEKERYKEFKKSIEEVLYLLREEIILEKIYEEKSS